MRLNLRILALVSISIIPVLPVQAQLSEYIADTHTLMLYHLNETSGSLSNAGQAGSGFDLDMYGGSTGRGGVTSGGRGATAFPGFGAAFDSMASGDGTYHSITSVAGGGAYASGATSSTQANYQSSEGALTWEAMVKVDSLNQLQVILSRDNATSNRGPSFFINGDLNFSIYESNIPTTGPHAFVANEWFHVAFTYNGNEGVTANAAMYWTRVDAQFTQANLLATFTVSADFSASSTGKLMIGSNARGEFRNEIDYIDEVCISDIARGADDFIFSGSRRLGINYLFQDHMVLQRDKILPVSGVGAVGGTIDLRLDGVPQGSTIIDGNGEWVVNLPAHPNDGGVSHVLTVDYNSAESIRIEDVIFGDVYLAVGQSNMEWSTGQSLGFAENEASAVNPNIRQIKFHARYAETVLDQAEIRFPWESVSPSTVGRFTGVGYYFAKRLYAETGVPIGLFNATYGGQIINRYVSPEGMELVPELAGVLHAEEEGIITSFYQIYNAMIAPLVPYGITAFLYYQGETDRGSPKTYDLKMKALIRGYRAAWGDDTLPFYYFQLPNFNQSYAGIRYNQLRALSEDNSGMAILIDVGDDTDIHPRNKTDPGERMAKWVLAKKFGQDIVYSGPIYYGTRAENGAIRVLFDYADGGLMIGQKSGLDPVVEVTGVALQNFEIAGSNFNFVAANAVIDADTVVVSSPSVSDPIYVRYCDAIAPLGGNKLYNHAGLPAAAFRTYEVYALDVAKGAGSSSNLASGATRTITASAPTAGKVFDRWIGADPYLNNPNSTTATLTMPDHDVYVIASYRDSAATSYSISLTNGSGGGGSQQGGIVTIAASAPAAGMVFDRWIGDTSFLVDPFSAVTSLRMPSSGVTFEAVYANAPAILAPSPLEFTVDSGNWKIEFMGANQRRYALQRKVSLTDASWENLIYNIKGNGTMISLDGAVNQPTSFFRIFVGE